MKYVKHSSGYPSQEEKYNGYGLGWFDRPIDCSGSPCRRKNYGHLYNIRFKVK